MEKTNPTSDVDYQRTFDEMGDWFRTEYQCRDYIPQLYSPDGFVCERCGVTAEPWVTACGVFRYQACGGSTSLTAGTVFQDARKLLRIWFLAMWFITRQKNCMSALVLKRALGLGSDETARAWLHKPGRAMARPARARQAGEIEIDETPVGGPEQCKWSRENEKIRRCGRSREKSSSNRSRPTQARQGYLRPKSAGLHSRGRADARNNSHQRMERLSGPALRQATGIA